MEAILGDAQSSQSDNKPRAFACVDSYRDDFLCSRNQDSKMGSEVEASPRDQRGKTLHMAIGAAAYLAKLEVRNPYRPQAYQPM
jgi:hypothetical protein